MGHGRDDDDKAVMTAMKMKMTMAMTTDDDHWWGSKTSGRTLARFEVRSTGISLGSLANLLRSFWLTRILTYLLPALFIRPSRQASIPRAMNFCFKVKLFCIISRSAAKWRAVSSGLLLTKGSCRWVNSFPKRRSSSAAWSFALQVPSTNLLSFFGECAVPLAAKRLGRHSLI